MPIGKKSIKRVANNGYSNVKSESPDMENSEVRETVTPVAAKARISTAETAAPKKGTRKSAAKKTESETEAKAETAKKSAESKAEPKKKAAASEKTEKKTTQRGRKTTKMTSDIPTAPEVAKAVSSNSDDTDSGKVALGDEMPVYLL